MTACRVCSTDFAPAQPDQNVCSIACARRIPAFNRKAAKAARADTRAKLAALKPRSKWLQEAQAAFNAWIRARDEHLGCISCGATTGKINAGHYLSVAARPELRFCESNARKQCERCNTYLHGNLIAYRLALVERVGQDLVDWLEGPHAPMKYTVRDLEAIRNDYRARVRDMKDEP